MKLLKATLAATALLFAATGVAAAQQVPPCESAPKAFAVKAVLIPSENRVAIHVDTLGFCSLKEAGEAAESVRKAVDAELHRVWEASLHGGGAPADIPSPAAEGPEGPSFQIDGILNAFADAFPKIEKMFEDYRGRASIGGVKSDDNKH